MAAPASPQSPHDPLGMGAVGVASLFLGWSLRLISQAFKAMKSRPQQPQPHPLSAVSEGTFSVFAKRTEDALAELCRQFREHESTTDRIEDGLRDLRGQFRTHTQVAFHTHEERLQTLENAVTEFLREERILNREFRERLDYLEGGSPRRGGSSRID